MKLKIPPVFQVLLFALLMYCVSRIVTGNHLNFASQKNTSYLFFAMGICIGILAVYAFRRAQTTVDPMQPHKASKLVVVGIYKISRNPMYLGMLFILIAFFVRLGNLYTLPILVLYIWYITTFQIQPEEEALIKLFGEEYTNYCKKVRRWI